MQVLKSFDPAATTSGLIDVSAAGADYKILLYNRSIVDIIITFDDGATALLHAGEANYFILDGVTPTLVWKQYSMLTTSQAAISQVSGQLYRQDEDVNGTYPMSLVYQLNIGNSVPLSTSATSISNEGNAVNTLVLDAGPAGNLNAVNVYNDGHMFWSVIQSAVAHQILKAQTAGNPLQIGQTGDVTEVLGSLTIDQIVHGLQSGNFDGASTIAGSTFALGGSATFPGQVTISGPGSALTVSGGSLNVTGGNSAFIGGNETITGQLTVNGPGAAITVNNGGITVNNSNSITASIYNLATGTLRALTSGSGTGNGTSNTAITNPTAVVFDPCTLSGSSQTIGGTTSTTTTVTTGSGLAWRYIAYLQ